MSNIFQMPTSNDWAEGEDAFPADNVGLTGDRRTEARLCVVQVLFQIVVQGIEVPAEGLTIVQEFMRTRVARTKADKKLFELVADEAVQGQGRYRAMIAAQLLEDWTLERIDPVLHAVMWAAAAELTANAALGPKVVLNEFINITKGFAKPEDVAFINATMDRLARQIRPEAF